MHIPSKVAVVALLAASTVALAGCVQESPQVIPTADPTVAPVFASDADALAAAKKAYVAYLAVSDQILIDGGANPERLLTVATPAELKSQMSGFKEFETKGWHSTGGTRISQIQLQGYFPEVKKGAVVTYVCVDVSNVDVLDSSGASVVSSSRPSQQPLQVTFDLSPSKRLILADQRPWNGTGLCP